MNWIKLGKFAAIEIGTVLFSLIDLGFAYWVWRWVQYLGYDWSLAFVLAVSLASMANRAEMKRIWRESFEGTLDTKNPTRGGA